MNKTFGRSLVLSCVLVSFALLPAAAATKKAKASKNADDRLMPPPMMMMHNPAMGGEQRGMRLHGASVFGTVTTVSEANGIISVKDADGKEKQIHVNPFTRIVKEANGKMDELKIGDVKAGQWIAVNKFESDTTTVEAQSIFVAAE